MTMVNGAYSTEKVTKTQVARFPWIYLNGEPLDIEMNPGDEFVLDEAGQFFQLHMLSKCRRVRTYTPRFHVVVDGEDPMWEVELRTSKDLFKGPEIMIGDDWLSYRRQGFEVGTEDLFRKFCEVIGSPVFNPYGELPPDGEVGGYRINIKKGTIRVHDGTPLPEEPVIPPVLLVGVEADVKALERKEGKPEPLARGVFEVSARRWERDGTVTVFQFDGLGEEAGHQRKMCVPADEFWKQADSGGIVFGHIEEEKPFHLSAYRVE